MTAHGASRELDLPMTVLVFDVGYVKSSSQRLVDETDSMGMS